MSPVPPPAKVLVTGATGFVGAWTVRAFLEAGYNVRGTVRSTSKGQWIANQPWAKAGPGAFEYVIVEDIETVGAFDEAVKGIDVVAHTASPVTFDAKIDPYLLINPAVQGAVGVLNSVLHHGPDVKRVVVTSSVAALLEPSESPRVYTEEDWNGYSVNDIENKGVSAQPIHKYRASKVKSESAVWEFVEQRKEKLNFEVTTILPAFVFGPFIHEVPSIDKLNESSKMFYEILRKEVPPPESTSTNYVDVRDVASMHVDAVASADAGGQRFIASAGTYIAQDIYDALNAHPDASTGVPTGTLGAGKNVKALVIYNTEKSQKVLGVKFRSLDEMAYDTLTSLKERGFW